MSDLSRNAADNETPVNPYSLLEAVNRSSDTAHMAWLIFLFIMTYLMIAVAGVTHRDLLLETPVSLPILQVDIPLTQFFQFSPIILVLFHLGVVGQLVLLARKTLEFDNAIRLLETGPRRNHPLRLELHNFFFVQAIAGPHRSLIMGGLLHSMTWLTLVILPVVLILYIQVMFLPYHDVIITWTHRIALVADVAMLTLIGVFLARAETSFFTALWRTTLAHPLSFLATASVIGAVTLFSFMVATVPGEALDRLGQTVLGAQKKQGEPQYYSGFMIPFVSAELTADGALFGVFHRNLVVTDTDLVVDREVSAGEPTVNLRGRELRYARLDRSDLHQADLTGADLEHASLAGTDLRDAWLNCADLNELLLSEDRKRAQCTTARNADFSRARLGRARMTGIDAEGARFEEADLDSAEMPYAILNGANFASARLTKADLTGGVQAQGASFLIAQLQGADLTSAKLHGADFRSAQLQGALLNSAHLEGTQFQDAKLEAASLNKAKLFAAKLARADIVATDMRGADVYLSTPPAADLTDLADLGGLDFDPPKQSDLARIETSLKAISNPATRSQVRDALAPLIGKTAETEGSEWLSSDDARVWRAYAANSPQSTDGVPTPQPVTTAGPSSGGSVISLNDTADYKPRLTEHLSTLICRPRWINGSVATGVSRRARLPNFRGDLPSIYRRLLGSECPASANMSGRLMQDLSATADVLRTN